MDLLDGAHKAVRRVLTARGVRSSFVRVGGHLLHHYRLPGERPGTRVLLVHGLGGSAGGYYKTLFSLARRFEAVHAVDLPGSGFSPLPACGLPSLSEQIDLLAGFCAEVVGQPAFWVGNSLGGAMCIAAASQRPEQVRALGLVAPAGAKVPDEQLSELFKALEVETPEQARALARRLFHRPPLSALLLAPGLCRMYGTQAARQVVAEARQRGSLDPGAIAALSMPTLLLWGESEKLLPFESFSFFQKHLPAHAEVHLVKGFGHVPHMERPRELVEHLVRFADRHGL